MHWFGALPGKYILVSVVFGYAFFQRKRNLSCISKKNRGEKMNVGYIEVVDLNTIIFESVLMWLAALGGVLLVTIPLNSIAPKVIQVTAVELLIIAVGVSFVAIILVQIMRYSVSDYPTKKLAVRRWE